MCVSSISTTERKDCTWQPEINKTFDPGGSTHTNNLHVYNLIAAAMSNAAAETNQSCTKLNSHTNMPVVGRHSYIISDHMREVDINDFSPDYDPICVPLVDVAIQYDSPYDGLQYLLVV